MIKQIKSSEIKKFIQNNSNTVLLDVRTEDEWKAVGKPDTKDLGIKSFFINWYFNDLEYDCCRLIWYFSSGFTKEIKY